MVPILPILVPGMVSNLPFLGPVMVTNLLFWDPVWSQICHFGMYYEFGILLVPRSKIWHFCCPILSKIWHSGTLWPQILPFWYPVWSKICYSGTSYGVKISISGTPYGPKFGIFSTPYGHKIELLGSWYGYGQGGSDEPPVNFTGECPPPGIFPCLACVSRIV